MQFYRQLDYQHIAYPSPTSPNGTLADNGCGVCAASMIVENLAQRRFAPDESAKLAIACGAREGFGTDMSIFAPIFSERFGLGSKATNDTSEVLRFLNERKGMAIANTTGDHGGWTGVFSESRHYIVLAGAEDHTVAVWDPMLSPGRYDIPGRAGKVSLVGKTAYADFSVIVNDCGERPYYLFWKLDGGKSGFLSIDSNFKEITLEGAPFDRGIAYGSSCRSEIRASIENYKVLFEDRKQISWERALRIAEKYIPAIEACGKEYMEEMRGIAQGAGVLFEEILAVNTRTEIMFTGQSCEDEDCQECTAFSASGPATRNNRVIAGQTWDFSSFQRDTTIVIHLKQANGVPDIMMFPEAGMIGGKGMNSAGISLTLNALNVAKEGAGLPLHVRMRRVLESGSFAMAYKRATGGDMASPSNLIITHRDGVAIGLEMDTDGIDVMLPEQGVIIHTNHFIGPRMVMRYGHAFTGSTYVRFQRAKQLLCGRTDITVDYMKDVLQDHVGYPISICAHPNTAEPEVKWNTTNFALIMDLTEGCAYFAKGNPCDGSFSRLTI